MSTIVPFSVSSIVGLVSAIKPGQKTPRHGSIIASRPLTVKDVIVDYAYVVYDGYRYRIYFHFELITDNLYESSASIGH